MPTIDLSHGTVGYRVAGPSNASAPPVVFVHAFLVDGSGWSDVADHLAARGIRSYAPDWPLGAHRTPLRPDADQSPRGVARQILAFLEALDLRDVTLVGNDTGGALCQLVVDIDAGRIGRLMLTNCDAFDTFPPFPYNIIFRLLGGELRMRINLQPMRWRAFRHSPLGLGLLADELDPVLTRAWIEPGLRSREIRRDAVRFLRAIDPKDLLDVSTRLKNFTGPVQIVWGSADRAFRPALGRRLQGAFRSATFVEVPGARTFVHLDAPTVLADQIVALSSARPAQD
ncbi:alpha/beta hydrolase [Nonomuraea sp. KC401]|uniref:alpha/beta fold hydrolase n=1 Tax=unclassified Nonomuraea TaxID=2593643 RepID=UPI0010FEA344|nr:MULTISPECIES: alpha/beta hydrolase [unclassified Nonomuraea]NBE94878.1 alpha/beta fold hydrolase [Nonomuraea sp. K271]TLF72264.1 alpha/beta hydrolase [Nonomuraea sp. KC401]